MATTDSDGDELERAFDEAAWDAEEEGSSVDHTSEVEIKETDCSKYVDASPTDNNVGNSARTQRVAPDQILLLPKEMLLRVLSLVPATGLTSCACACKGLAIWASDNLLWRRLYIARWGQPTQAARGTLRWKSAYLSADGEEWEATLRDGRASDDPALAAIFLDMLRAKRDTAPDRRLLDRALETDPGDISAKVAAWRRARGLHAPPLGASDGAGCSDDLPAPPRPDLSRTGRAAYTFTHVNPGEQPPIYVCDQTGWVHLCGDACTEGEVDARSELLVCPVSGQTTDRLVHECEDEEADGARCGGGGGGGGTVGEEEGGVGVFGGGFGSFFVAGYECENEKALNKLLGYKAL